MDSTRAGGPHAAYAPPIAVRSHALRAPAAPAATASNGANHPTPTTSLVGPSADLWLLGGASLVLWAIVAALSPLRPTSPAVDRQLRNLVLVLPTLALFVNYPHFIASYRLAYGEGTTFVARRCGALVVVPVALGGALLVGIVTYGSTVSRFGIRVDRFGEHTLGWLVVLMYFSVGWHYVKQAYGCTRVMAHQAAYSISRREARVLKWALVPVWLSPFVRANTGGARALYGVPYPSLDLPQSAVAATNVLIGAGIAALLLVAASARRRNGDLPPLRVVIPVAAMVVWWLPAAYNPIFFATLPLFHSLQYLPFVFRVRQSQLAERHASRPARRRALVLGTIGLMLIGWAAFEIAPGLLDRGFGSPEGTSAAVFLLAATLFLNIHHYCIDHVLWRFDNSMVRRHLLT